MQLDNTVIDGISRNILGVFEKMGQTREELHRKVHDVVREAVEHFDLATREDLDVAMRLLGNTRSRLEEMERRVAELEARLGDDGPA
ncbi:MAG: accessory factor UbiK family protein [Magnetococcus sp. WYHC-3]